VRAAGLSEPAVSGNERTSEGFRRGYIGGVVRGEIATQLPDPINQLRAVDRLAADGPALGRPLVDRINGSRHHNMKELRPGSTGSSEIRILFAFDPTRRAVLLVAGDKSGNWRGWYNTAIPLADDRYDTHLAELETRNYQ
jgi:hypothetical protein